MRWQYSSLGVKALADALKSSGLATRALERVRPETRQALENPTAVRWHDGAAVVDLTLTVEALAGPAAVQRLFHDHLRHHLGPVLEPFIKVMLVLTGRDPGAMLARMDGSLKTLMMGVSTRWCASSPSSGTLSVVHEDPMQPVTFHAWRGPLEYSLELCNASGSVVPRLPSQDGRTYVFDVSWSRNG